MRAFVLPMADVETGDTCSTPIEVEIDVQDSVVLPISGACPTSTLVIVNTASPGGDEVEADWYVSLDADSATMSTPAVEIGFTELGNLIDSPSHEPGATSQPLGLRLIGEPDTEVLGWGCACEGWGVGTPGDPARSGGVSWGNGTSNVELNSFEQLSSTSITSTVSVAGAYLVKHSFHPSPSPNLIQIDVEVSYVGPEPAPKSVFYRRVFDWDIPPTVYREYTTMATGSGGGAAFVAHTSDDGFANPSPASARTQIRSSGFFTDSGEYDNGGQVELSLGSFEKVRVKTFTIYYGAAASEAGALAAVDTVSADVYSLGQDNPDSGAPVTAIFAANGSSLRAGTTTARASQLKTLNPTSERVKTMNRDRAQRTQSRGAN